MIRTRILAALLCSALFAWGIVTWMANQRRTWIASATVGELERFGGSHPDDADVQARIGVLDRNAGNDASAEKRLRRAIDLAPNEVRYWVELSRTISDDRQAIGELERFEKIMPASAPLMSELARRYLLGGDADRARDLTQKALQFEPDSPDALRSYGDLMAANRRSPESEQAYRKSLALRDDPETRLALARLYIPLQRYTEIIAVCEPIVKAGKSPDISLDQRARALLYTGAGRLYEPLTPESTTALQSQLLEAESLSAHLSAKERFLPPYFLGESYLRTGRPREAIPFLEQSAKEGPMFAGSLYSLARAYRLSGETEKANSATSRHVRLSRTLTELEACDAVLRERPNDSDTLLRLADTLVEAGNPTDATQVYSRLLTMGKHVDTARRRLEELSAPSSANNAPLK